MALAGPHSFGQAFDHCRRSRPRRLKLVLAAVRADLTVDHSPAMALPVSVRLLARLAQSCSASTQHRLDSRHSRPADTDGRSYP